MESFRQLRNNIWRRVQNMLCNFIHCPDTSSALSPVSSTLYSQPQSVFSP